MATPDTRPFHFRQFSLHHHRSTMKTGTDAVLLALWAPLEDVGQALDIGTGSGIISLLLAARSEKIRVDAVDLDTASAEEAKENFELSPFAGRLQAFRADVKDFALAVGKKYDLVISNPPFFINDHKPEKTGRKLARHTDSLSYAQLVAVAAKLLKPAGRFAVVLPYRESRMFVELAEGEGLFLQRQRLIFPRPCYEPNRVNLLLGTSPARPITEKFVIRDEAGTFTPQYTDVVKNYYLSP